METTLEPTIYNLANSRATLKFNNSDLAQKSSLLYSNFILILCIVYKWNYRQLNPTNNFPIKSCILYTVKLVWNLTKSKFTYSGRGIVFDGEGMWSFLNEFSRTGVIFGVDNSWSLKK